MRLKSFFNQVKEKLSPELLLVVIVFLGIFFRVYHLADLFAFAHDQDIFSWIIKDIAVDHHLRLIGQLTSVDGIFIGPFYYYLLALFYILFNFNPLSANIPAILIGVATIISCYFVFSKFFGKASGLIAAFVYAVSIFTASYDRWVVPTQLTLLWSIWFIYFLFKTIRGEFKGFVFFGVLAGMVWHIHIALFPLLFLVPISLLLSGKKIPYKQIIFAFIVFMLISAPFWIFEFKYGWTQVNSFFNSLEIDRRETSGFGRVIKAIRSFPGLLTEFVSWKRYLSEYLISFFIFVILFINGLIKKLLSKKQFLVVIFWILIVYVSQILSKRPISEYYFQNLSIIFLLFFSVFLANLLRGSLAKFVYLFLIIYLGLNFIRLSEMAHATNTNYSEKIRLVDFIVNDAKAKGYPCIALTHITSLGNNVGFRYLFWWKKMVVVEPNSGAPIYNIVNPYVISGDEVEKRFGLYGLILPKNSKFTDKKICENPADQLQELWGFTK